MVAVSAEWGDGRLSLGEVAFPALVRKCPHYVSTCLSDIPPLRQQAPAGASLLPRDLTFLQRQSDAANALNAALPSFKTTNTALAVRR